MSALPVSRYPVPELANLPADIRDKILAVQEKAGLPNVFLTLLHPAVSSPRLQVGHDAPSGGDYTTKRRAGDGLVATWRQRIVRARKLRGHPHPRQEPRKQ